jgi:hypothetical protein
MHGPCLWIGHSQHIYLAVFDSRSLHFRLLTLKRILRLSLPESGDMTITRDTKLSCPTKFTTVSRVNPVNENLAREGWGFFLFACINYNNDTDAYNT